MKPITVILRSVHFIIYNLLTIFVLSSKIVIQLKNNHSGQITLFAKKSHIKKKYLKSKSQK